MTVPAHAEQPGREAWHRRYVGGLWERLGRLQFEFLVGRGLRPEHVLLDVACGSLRAGVRFIPYLNAGNYLGLDRNEALIAAGVQHELNAALVEEKRPVFVVSESFEFERFDVRPNYALAQSLFTHLPPHHIQKCLQKLRKVLAREGEFYATFNESAKPVLNPPEPHDHQVFRYPAADLARFGQATGWSMEYLGRWNHPRGQRMVVYRPAELA